MSVYRSRLENNEASHPLLATCVSEIGELQNWEECLLASQAVSREMNQRR